jgi:uncharacterized damage-inducible protein DinB
MECGEVELMKTEDFKANWAWVHRMTVDFVNVVPADKWEFTPAPKTFGSFCRQLRHVVRGRGVYNAAMRTKKADWSKSAEHYSGPLTREALLEALEDMQRHFLAALESVEADAPIYFGETTFTFDNFLCEMIQHESIHHGQWSVYAALGGFETPRSWQTGWKM